MSVLVNSLWWIENGVSCYFICIYPREVGTFSEPKRNTRSFILCLFQSNMDIVLTNEKYRMYRSTHTPCRLNYPQKSLISKGFPMISHKKVLSTKTPAIFRSFILCLFQSNMDILLTNEKSRMYRFTHTPVYWNFPSQNHHSSE